MMAHEMGRFDVSWRLRSQVIPCAKGDIDRIVRECHYLRKWPAVCVARFAMVVDGEVRGACIFAMPPRETFKRYGGLTWELARLWIDDGVPRNAETWFVAKCLRWIRVHRRDVVAIVSYADPSAGHHGGIYVAGNWEDDGHTDEGRKTPRCDYEAGGKRYQRRSQVPPGLVVTRVPRVSKFRYVYRIQKVNDGA